MRCTRSTSRTWWGWRSRLCAPTPRRCSTRISWLTRRKIRARSSCRSCPLVCATHTPHVHLTYTSRHLTHTSAPPHTRAAAAAAGAARRGRADRGGRRRPDHLRLSRLASRRAQSPLNTLICALCIHAPTQHRFSSGLASSGAATRTCCQQTTAARPVCSTRRAPSSKVRSYARRSRPCSPRPSPWATAAASCAPWPSPTVRPSSTRSAASCSACSASSLGG